MKRLVDIVEYKSIVARYKRKGVYTNDYLQQNVLDFIIQDSLFVDYYENNVFLFVRKDIGYRVYYYINDSSEIANFGQYKDLVIEILFRGPLPQDEIDYFIRCGFHTNLIRDQYLVLYKDIIPTSGQSSDILIERATTVEEVKIASKLFNDTFDKLSGDYITENDYDELLTPPHTIFMAWDKEKDYFLGAFHFTIDGGTVFGRHLAVTEQARGRGVGKALLNAYLERNKVNDKTRYLFWVQRQNKAAVTMYVNKGFKPINKSTISLIKK